jgi:hypothetical protein
MMDLANKTAFVTGAASGIGLGIATALAPAGAKVMLCDTEEPALGKAVEGLKSTNADVDGVKADVSLKEELEAAAKTTLARYGKVHVLVNNAEVVGMSLLAPCVLRFRRKAGETGAARRLPSSRARFIFCRGQPARSGSTAFRPSTAFAIQSPCGRSLRKRQPSPVPTAKPLRLCPLRSPPPLR